MGKCLEPHNVPSHLQLTGRLNTINRKHLLPWMGFKHCSCKIIFTWRSFQGEHTFHFLVSKSGVCPHGQGGVAARQCEWEGITQHDYSLSLCLCLCSSTTALVSSPATDRELAAACSHRVIPQQDDLPSSGLASNTLIHSSTYWLLPARQVWVGATQCFHSLPQHLN